MKLLEKPVVDQKTRQTPWPEGRTETTRRPIRKPNSGPVQDRLKASDMILGPILGVFSLLVDFLFYVAVLAIPIAPFFFPLALFPLLVIVGLVIVGTGKFLGVFGLVP